MVPSILAHCPSPISPRHQHSSNSLVGTAANNARLALGGAVLGTASLDRLDGSVRVNIAVWNLTKDDVLAIEPGGDNGGNEKLGAVAVKTDQYLGSKRPEARISTYVLGPALAIESRNGLLCFN